MSEVEHKGTIVSHGEEVIVVQEGDKQVQLWVGTDLYVEGYEDGCDENGYPAGAVCYWVTYDA